MPSRQLWYCWVRRNWSMLSVSGLVHGCPHHGLGWAGCFPYCTCPTVGRMNSVARAVAPPPGFAGSTGNEAVPSSLRPRWTRWRGPF
jgi:hypothetical protein